MKKTQLMAILNLSTDSFYEESRNSSLEIAVAKAIQLQEQGADILDIGGQSTRPGSEFVGAEEELRRLEPVLDKIKDCLHIPISIDTTSPKVAKRAIEAGATLINDISGLSDPKMVELAASTGVDVCVMHMRGTPKTMQSHLDYNEGIVEHLLWWFEQQTNHLIRNGIASDKIIIDPGIGFAKNVEDNFKIIHGIKDLKKLGFRVLLGTSRKSFMGKVLNKSASQLLAATLAVNTMAILSSVDMIRVHDVEEHRDIIDLLAAESAMR